MNWRMVERIANSLMKERKKKKKNEEQVGEASFIDRSGYRDSGRLRFGIRLQKST